MALLKRKNTTSVKKKGAAPVVNGQKIKKKVPRAAKAGKNAPASDISGGSKGAVGKLAEDTGRSRNRKFKHWYDDPLIQWGDVCFYPATACPYCLILEKCQCSKKQRTPKVAKSMFV